MLVFQSKSFCLKSIGNFALRFQIRLALFRFINGVSISDPWSSQRCGILCPQCVIKDINLKLDISQFPSSCSFCRKAGVRTYSTLENVLEKLILPAMSSDNKNLFVSKHSSFSINRVLPKTERKCLYLNWVCRLATRQPLLI